MASMMIITSLVELYHKEEKNSTAWRGEATEEFLFIEKRSD